MRNVTNCQIFEEELRCPGGLIRSKKYTRPFTSRVQHLYLALWGTVLRTVQWGYCSPTPHYSAPRYIKYPPFGST
eukprot:11902247-Ditylum_brightwellii.AAC.1